MTGAAPDRRQDQRACSGLGWCVKRDAAPLGEPYCDGVGRCVKGYAVSPVPGQQREAVADELARHADTMAYTRDDDTVRLGCRCGHERGTVTKAGLAANLDGWMRAHRLHVADAVIAVIEGHQP